MKNTIFKSLIPALLVMLSLSGCQDDVPSNQLSKNEAEVAIADFNATASNDLQALSGSTGTAALQDMFYLIDLDDPFGRVATTDREKLKAFFKGKGKAFKSIFIGKAINGRTTEEGSFDFNANKGIYTWDADLDIFEKTDKSNIIIIRFPTEESTTNNAELQLKAYSEVEIYDEEWDEYSYLPTDLLAELYVNESKVASIDFEATWDEVGFPISADIALMVNNFSLNLSVDTSGTTSSSLSLTFKQGEEIIVDAAITVKYDDASKSEESLKTIEGFVQIKNLKVQGNIDMHEADAVEVDWNKVFNLTLYSNNEKLGDIVFVDVDDEPVPYVKYADGSKVELETVFQPVIDEAESIADDFEGE